MSRMDYFHQGGTPFDAFLYAELGEDKVGNRVSVLSALARLGRDPWDEAAELSALSNAAAQTRLGVLLARFPDVPAPDHTLKASIARLVGLLPNKATRPQPRAETASATSRKLPSMGQTIAILVLIMFLVQTFVLGSDGSGN